jgi:hypothetical protein
VSLAVGCAFAVSALFGNPWFARVGLVVLAVTAVVAVREAWKEVVETKLEGHNQLVVAENTHQELLFETRQSATIVREVLRKRNSVLAETLTATRSELTITRTEVIERNRLITDQIRVMSAMRGDLAAARVERDELAGHVTMLIGRVSRLEDHMTTATDSAEVLSLPRRVQRPERDANWNTDELPAVAELPQLPATSPATPVWKQA